MKTNNTRLIALAALIVIPLGLLIALLYRGKSLPFSEDILYLTQPVHTVTGKVTGVDATGFTLAVEGKYTAPDDRPNTKTLVYRVTVDSRTGFLQAPQKKLMNFPGYSTDEINPNISLGSVKENQEVGVRTAQDIRQIKDGILPAQEVRLPAEQKEVNGTVVSIGNSQLTIKLAQTQATSEENKDPYIEETKYAFRLNKDTKYYQYPAKPPAPPAEIALEDIKPGDELVVLSDRSIYENGTPNAVAIMKAPARPLNNAILTP